MWWKDNFNKILEVFSTFIKNIEDLILLLNEISNKGYPEHLSYEINILKGNLNIKKNKRVECKIKNEMRIIKNIKHSKFRIRKWIYEEFIY